MKIYSKEIFLGWLVMGLLLVALFAGKGSAVLAILCLTLTCIMLMAACMPQTEKTIEENAKSIQREMYRKVFGRYGGYAPYVSVELFVLSQVITTYWPKLFVLSAVILVAGVIHFAWFILMISMYKRRNK